MPDEPKLYLEQFDDGNPDIGFDGERGLTTEQRNEMEALVGKVLFNFNHLETVLDCVIAEVVNERAYGPGYTITSELNSVFAKKILVFKALYGPAVKYLENKEFSAVFNALWKRLFKLKDSRNEITHADWSNASNEYDVRLRIATDEGGPYAIRRLIKPDQLEALAKELEECAVELEGFSELADTALGSYQFKPKRTKD
jgi:hypothetical protein